MKTRWIASMVLSGVLLACGVAYVALDRETVVLDNRVRERLGGTYAPLESGSTHYILSGDEGGTPVVLLHGSTIAIWDFDLQVPVLEKAGVRLLRYDALGKGLSDRPDRDYTRHLYVKQLRQLLDHLGIGRAILVGHSLGGAVAMEFASLYPARVQAVALVSPVINSVQSLPPFVVCNLPVVGDFVYRVAMAKVMEARARGQWLEADVDMAAYEALYEQQATIEGFEHAICSMFQTDLVGDYRPAYGKVAAAGIPVALFYGEDDPVIGLHYVDVLKATHGGFSFHPLAGAAHSPHVQALDVFNEQLLDFLDDHR